MPKAPTKEPKVNQDTATAGVSKAEFEAFQKSTNDTQNKILEILERNANPVVAIPATAVDRKVLTATAPGQVISIGLENQAEAVDRKLPVQYQRIVDKHFDPADGFSTEWDLPTDESATRSAITFAIIVPDKFSNASAAYKKFYKEDRRTVVIRPESITRDIDSWCVRVAKNIRYNKKLVTK